MLSVRNARIRDGLFGFLAPLKIRVSLVRFRPWAPSISLYNQYLKGLMPPKHPAPKAAWVTTGATHLNLLGAVAQPTFLRLTTGIFICAPQALSSFRHEQKAHRYSNGSRTPLKSLLNICASLNDHEHGVIGTRTDRNQASLFRQRNCLR